VSVRELLAKCRLEVLNGNLSPTRTGEIAAQLSALLSNICEEIREREMAFNAVYSKHLDDCGKANRAAIKAKLTPEYGHLREAQDTEKVTTEMIRSLRRLQDTQRVEMHLAR
jgi:hypothetical protein